MFIKPYNFVLFTSHTRDLENFSVVSVLAFILPTPGGGVVKVTKDHKKISCLMGPYNTDSGNHYINNHGMDYFLKNTKDWTLSLSRRVKACLVGFFTAK